MSETPAPAEYAPHMVMARHNPKHPSSLDIYDPPFPSIPTQISKDEATPILTVSLEEAARRAWDRWEGKPGWLGLPEGAKQSVRDVVLAVCALKVREARDVAPRALPDREALARTIFGIMTFGGTWSSSEGILEMRSLCTADRALELCAGAAVEHGDKTAAKVLALEANLYTAGDKIRSLQAQLASAQTDLRVAEERAETAWKERAALGGEVAALRGRLENLLTSESDEISKQRARAEKAEAERDALRIRVEAVDAENAKLRSEHAELRKPSNLTDEDLYRAFHGISHPHFPMGGFTPEQLERVRSVANAAAARARAQAKSITVGVDLGKRGDDCSVATVFQVPAKPTLAELEAREEYALDRAREARAASRKVPFEDEYNAYRTKAIAIYRQAEYGRAADAVDAAKEQK